VELSKEKSPRMYEISPLEATFRMTGGVFGKGRILLGRSESCDLSIGVDAISAIHAVMEIFDDRAIIYDMNSTNGTYVGGEKVVAKEIKLGDKFSLANVDFHFKRYVAADALPPILDNLEPAAGIASVRLPEVIAQEAVKTLPQSAPKVSQQSMPSIVYPLAADPKAEFCEYIFEDKEVIYPIFKYESTRQSVEVIILFKDQIFSVDYLPEGKLPYFMTGVLGDSNELEFPYLGKNEKFEFVNVSSYSATVHVLPGFSVFHLSDKKKDTGHVGATVELAGQDIVRLQKGDLQIFVRHVAAPPAVASAPILKRDPDFQKYLFLLLFLVFFVSVGLNVIEVPEDEKKEELAPERLATILYRQKLSVSKNRAVEKTEDAPKVVQRAPNKPAVQKDVPKEVQPDVKKPDLVETKIQTNKPDPGKKTATEKKIVKQGQSTPSPTQVAAAAQPAASKNANTAAAKSPVPQSQLALKTAGHVEVYKSADFKSSLSTLVAKGGSLSGVNAKTFSSSGGDLVGSTSGISAGTGQIKTANIATPQGSLVGATTGSLGDSKGAEGLSSKRAIYSAGIPSETVVLGSMDPDVIRRILLDHLPQFRYCYQKELERSGVEASGTVKLNFTIGASGHVSQAGIDGSSGLPSEVKRCVVGVLRGISFPEPQGGGTVEVKQPMNFYPKKI
jgi:outer membrane biosynthesis protein TonB